MSHALPPNATVQLTSFLLHIQKVLASNLGPIISRLSWQRVLVVLLSSSDRCGIVPQMTSMSVSSTSFRPRACCLLIVPSLIVWIWLLTASLKTTKKYTNKIKQNYFLNIGTIVTSDSGAIQGTSEGAISNVPFVDFGKRDKFWSNSLV